MAVTKDQKVQILKELKEKMQQSKSILFAHYIGMTVADVSELRGNLKKGNAEMKVAKKNLMRIAAKESNLPEPPEDLLDGPVACIFSFEDPLSGGQIAFKFAKTHKQVELIGGIWEGKLISKDEAIAIAQIPGREALLGMFMAMCQGPLSSFARGLKELAQQKQKGEAEAAKPVATETPAAVEPAPTPAPDAPAAAETAMAEAPSAETPQA